MKQLTPHLVFSSNGSWTTDLPAARNTRVIQGSGWQGGEGGREQLKQVNNVIQGMLERATADREGEAITRDVNKSKVKEKEERMAREASWNNKETDKMKGQDEGTRVKFEVNTHQTIFLSFLISSVLTGEGQRYENYVSYRQSGPQHGS